jgi:hypothetical protein
MNITTIIGHPNETLVIDDQFVYIKINQKRIDKGILNTYFSDYQLLKCYLVEKHFISH